MVVGVHHLRIAVAAGLLLISPSAGRVGDATSFQVVKGESLLRCDHLVDESQGNESLPCRVQAGLAERSTVAGHDDVPT